MVGPRLDGVVPLDVELLQQVDAQPFTRATRASAASSLSRVFITALSTRKDALRQTASATGASLAIEDGFAD